MEPPAVAPASETAPIAVDPTWYKDAIIYELHVRAFADSKQAGTGDFPGLTGKLDYLRDLGVTALWLLPFYPSPLLDDGYDISDYTGIHPNYGTLREFRNFLREAHARGLRVITELVLNHTSDQHWWFQRARQAPPGSTERDYYLWSDTPDRFSGARIIFNDFERSNWTWDPAARAYYFHRFYSHQPDLNYDNPVVVRAISRTIDAWLEMGVDGLRLDAIPYLFKREGTNCENLPETHAFLRALRHRVDEKFPGRMLLAEANQWPEDAAAYFGTGSGDECHTAFHFPLMPRLFMATRMGTRFPILDVLNQTPRIPTNCQWLLFLRNHDELTLEMVSDEERDYMYRAYAHDARMRVNVGIRRRLAPLLSNDRRLIELMNGLLFSLPGTPVLYYGDEIGMGDNIYLGDRNSVRTPMQWSADRNAGFSRTNPQRIYLPVIIDPEYHYETVNVEAQQGNPHSLLWHMKRIIALRRQTRVFGRGSTTFLYPANSHVLAFVRAYEGEQVLVVANLCHLAQPVDLDLRDFRGMRPIELFGQTPFPPVTYEPYRLTLGPYEFGWFRLETPITATGPTPAATVEPVVLAARGDWAAAEEPAHRERIDTFLFRYLPTARWFRGKGLPRESVHWARTIAFGTDAGAARLALVEVRYADSDPQTYLLPIGFTQSGPPSTLAESAPSDVLAIFRPGAPVPDRLLHDVAQAPEFVRQTVGRIARNRRRRVDLDELVATRTKAFDREDTSTSTLPVVPLRGEQSNSSAKIGDQYILKTFRLVERGQNPEIELGQFLLRHPPAPVAPLAGFLELRTGSEGVYSLASLHRFVPNEGDAWGLTIDHLRGYFDRARAHYAPGRAAPKEEDRRIDLAGSAPPAIATELVGAYLEQIGRLGQRTAEFHRALASDPTDPAFAPEPFDQLYVRSILQTMDTQRQQAFELLRSSHGSLPSPGRELAEGIIGKEDVVYRRFHRLLEHRYGGQRIRIHGDYHLGQVLWTGKDFVIIDLEGEPLRSITERRLKRSPLRDVAGMLRSFDYAARVTLQEIPLGGAEPAGAGRESLQPLAELWVSWVSSAFLRGYRDASENAPFVPHNSAEIRQLLGAYVLEKSLYEVRYEINNRPKWVEIPLRGLTHLLASEE
ncbi:MAG: maltose alpha-D-glucosyltransferase [Thermoplasmata archaeon]